MPYDHRKCEDEDDAVRMAETILRELGYVNVNKGANILGVNVRLSKSTLNNIAKNAERIARWARGEMKNQ